MLRRKNKKDEGKRKKLEPRFIRKKVCRFCKGKDKTISYRQVEFLNSFVSERGRIMPARISGNCAKHQRMVTRAIKRARELALLPFCG